MNPNSTPLEGLSGSLPASGAKFAPVDPEAANGPQVGAEGPEPREVIRDAIATTLNAGSYWLPIEGQRAIADALVDLRTNEAEKWRRLAIARGLELGRLQRTLELAEAAARAWADDHNGADCAQAVLDALTAHQPKEQP